MLLLLADLQANLTFIDNKVPPVTLRLAAFIILIILVIMQMMQKGEKTKAKEKANDRFRKLSGYFDAPIEKAVSAEVYFHPCDCGS